MSRPSMLSSRSEAGIWPRNSSPHPVGTRYLRSMRVVAGAAASTSGSVIRGSESKPGRSGTDARLVRRGPVRRTDELGPVAGGRLDVGGVAQAGQARPALLDTVPYGDHGGLP